MNYPELTLAFVLGVIIGSFLNVVIYRLPRHQKMAFDRSRCPQCRQQLRWYHNVPLLSYLLLRGRCAFCGCRIAIRYPIVEVLNGLIYAYLLWHLGLTVELAAFALLSSALVAIFFIDLDFQIIPDVITLPGLLIGLLLSLLPGGIGIIDALIGAAAGGGSLYLIALLGDWLFKKESMGGGDIKMAAMLGAFLGWEKVLLVFIMSAVIGLVVSVALMVFSSRLRRERIIPFGPFLAAAAFISVLYGDAIIAFYLSRFLFVS
jgi:leader peptidase (prepilin peptidase)/N-methyltransferase